MTRGHHFLKSESHIVGGDTWVAWKSHAAVVQNVRHGKYTEIRTIFLAAWLDIGPHACLGKTRRVAAAAVSGST